MRGKKAFKVSFIKAFKPCMEARGKKRITGKIRVLYGYFQERTRQRFPFFVPLNVTHCTGGSRKPELLAHTWTLLSSDNNGIKRSWAASAEVKRRQTPSKGPKVTATNFMTMNTGPSPDQASELRVLHLSPFPGRQSIPFSSAELHEQRLWAQTVL